MGRRPRRPMGPPRAHRCHHLCRWHPRGRARPRACHLAGRRGQSPSLPARVGPRAGRHAERSVREG
eukprot:10947246-Alexandrium_andersonii.AAC.2